MLNLDGGVKQYLVDPELTENVSSKRYNRIVDIAYTLLCAMEAKNRIYANIMGLETVEESVETIKDMSMDKLTRDLILALYLFDGSIDNPVRNKYVIPTGFDHVRYNRDKKAVYDENKHLELLLKNNELVMQALQLMCVSSGGEDQILDGGEAETKQFVNDRKEKR